MPSPLPRWTLLGRTVRAAALLVALGAACGIADLSLEVTVPKGLVSKTKWFEVGAYKDASCKVLTPMLANGLPEGMNARAAFKKEDRVGPRFGDIPAGKYAFAAVARDGNCAILATTCSEHDVTDTSKITLALKAVDEPTGQCPDGASCQAGKCLPANNNADPSIGAGCSLELLGAGPLLNLMPEGALMSAPSIAPMANGFIIVYRQNSPSGGEARVVMLPVDPAGGIYGVDKRDELVNAPTLDSCSRADETDGIGLVAGGEDGIVAVAENCDPKRKFSLFNFAVTKQDNGKLDFSLASQKIVTDAGELPLALGAARSAAVRGEFGAVQVFTTNGVARIAGMDKTRGVIGPTGVFGADTGITDAWVAGNEQVLALLAATGSPPSTAKDPDSGAPEPIEGPALLLQLLDAGTPIATITPASSRVPIAPISGTWGSIAANGGRVIVLSDGSDIGQSASYHAFDLNGDGSVAESGGIEFQDDNDLPVTAGDVAIVGDRAYFAVLKAGAIELHVFQGASTKPRRLRRVSLGREPRISAINRVGDGRVAVAATPDRVAVAWTTKKKTDQNDPAGGYAVFACTP